MRKTLIAVLISACLVAGCVSMGTNYNEQRASQLQPGMTKAAVIAALGKPNSVVTTSDGRQQLMWIHSTGSMFGAKARSITLPFDRNGMLLQIPGGNSAAAGYPPAAASTSTVRLGGLSSDIQTNSAVSMPVAVGPTIPLPPGVQRLGADVWLYPAPSKSGHCLQAPADYRGTGSSTRPAVTKALPRCQSPSR